MSKYIYGSSDIMGQHVPYPAEPLSHTISQNIDPNNNQHRPLHSSNCTVEKMAPHNAYPRSVMKRIVKAHSDRNLSKNADVLIYLDYALFLQESVFLLLVQNLSCILRRLTHQTDSSANPRSNHKPSSPSMAPTYQRGTRNPSLQPGTSGRFLRSAVLLVRLSVLCCVSPANNRDDTFRSRCGNSRVECESDNFVFGLCFPSYVWVWGRIILFSSNDFTFGCNQWL